MQPDEKKALVLMQEDRIARKKEKRVRSGRRHVIGWRRRMMRRTTRRGKRLRLISRMGEVGVRGGRFESGCRMSTCIFGFYRSFTFFYRTTISVPLYTSANDHSPVHEIQ